MPDHRFWTRLGVLMGVAGGLLLAGWLGVGRQPPPAQRTITPLLMGTTSRLIAVGPADQLDAALQAALAELWRVESAMSTYDPGSELSRLNRAAAGKPVALSPATLEVLAAAGTLHAQSQGAFDATIKPLAELWAEAGRRNEPPRPEELAAARKLVGFENLSLLPGAAVKSDSGVSVSLDGIAKGYGIHRAILAMRQYPLVGGLVDVGGDVECFGRPAADSVWRIGVQHPRSGGQLGVLHLGGAGHDTVAVCTSGDYRRYVTIGGRRLSHILDPRTGWPAEHAAGVTVVGPNAIDADGWATACAVLGPDDGLRLLANQPGLQALWALQDESRSDRASDAGGNNRAPLTIRMSEGFRRYLVVEDNARRLPALW
ncbi:MAG: FAD:protein FMN transferase [Pirellulaceae bacterium]|nr:FAD:protein FMN transferase [Pirellulaceae bacterium]